jgi:hypothetical protein
VTYPRDFTQEENEIFDWLLPRGRETYARIRDHLDRSLVIGEGRWGSGDLLCIEPPIPEVYDTIPPMTEVIASGVFTSSGEECSISVHSPNSDSIIEVQITGSISGDIQPLWCYSYWQTGMLSPRLNASVREVLIPVINGQMILAISPDERSVWLHHPNGWNQLVPVTKFADELMRVHKIRDAKIVTDPSNMFTMLSSFSDAEISLGFREYARRSKHFESLIPILTETGTQPKKRTFFSSILRRKK